jgi:aryl-alcohol dehydrogenase-like predicted oxidoreductase
MLYRKLGNTGYDISTIGFGTWQIGGGRWDIPSEKEIITLLQDANNVGINIFDVAVVYGQYKDSQGYLQSRSQEFLGKAFVHSRQQVIYCLKLGQFDEYSHRHNYNPKRIVEQFLQSLRRLQTDYVDIALIHAPSIQFVKDGKAITILQTLQALGHIKNIGYSFEAEPEHVSEAIKQPIDVIMLQYNLLDTQCEKVIEQARLHGIGVLVGGPLKRGYLTGKFRKLDDLPKKDDYWQLNINLNKEKVETLLKQVDFLLEQYSTPENLRRESLNFVLKQPGVASCIIGHRCIDEVLENIQLIKKDTTTIFHC